MADGSEPKPTAGPTGISRVRDPQFREFYANGSLTGLGPFDVTFTFTRSSDLAGQGVVLLDQAAVTMSPQHFKNFVRAANATFTAYENVFGTLQIPDDVTAPGTSAEQLEAMLRAARAKAEAASTTTSSSSSSTEKKRPSKRSRGAAH